MWLVEHFEIIWITGHYNPTEMVLFIHHHWHPVETTPSFALFSTYDTGRIQPSIV